MELVHYEVRENRPVGEFNRIGLEKSDEAIVTLYAPLLERDDIDVQVRGDS
jgi:hypothetical protein